MMWRSIVIIFIHMTVALLIWAGYSWISIGQGLNPLIAFPGALILYGFHLIWINDMCQKYDCEDTAVLELIDRTEDILSRKNNDRPFPDPTSDFPKDVF